MTSRLSGLRRLEVDPGSVGGLMLQIKTWV
jgi:hypothetical protein